MKPAYIRVLEKVVEDKNGCWIFMGATDGRGYGKVALYKEGKTTVTERAHRIMYMTVHGPIPNDLVVRHKCDVKRCCNPSHLEIGTPSENMYDYIHRQRKLPDIEDAPF